MFTIANMTEESFGQRLRRLRDARKWSMEQLGSRANGLSRAYIQQLETGKRTNPGMDIVIPLADALGVPIDELVRGTQDNQPSALFDSPEEQVAKEYAPNMTLDEIRDWLKLLNNADAAERHVARTVIERSAKGRRTRKSRIAEAGSEYNALQQEAENERAVEG